MEDGEEELEAENVLIATGSAVGSLPGLEFDGEKVISSDDVVNMNDHYPESVIILGSGAVGVEFASMYNDFGTEVTVVELLDRHRARRGPGDLRRAPRRSSTTAASTS